MTQLRFDMDDMTNFLIGLLDTPSPTGYHREAIAYVKNGFEALNIPDLVIETTRKGALLITWRGQSDAAPRALTAHIDTLGFMVKEIKSNGNLKLTNLGGINWAGAEFENCTIRTFDDTRYRGTVILNNPSTHANRTAHSSDRNESTMEVRVDARTSSRQETEALGINVGDFIFLDPRIEVTETGFIRARFLDDKVSVACIYGALKALRDAGQRPAQDTAILISNYEEVGHGGSSGLPADIAELVVVDMAVIGDGQASDEYSVTICAKDGGGPYHFDLTSKLRRMASAHNIAHRVDIYLYYSSDGTAYWRAGGDAQVALIGPGVASSHGYERTHKDAISQATHLIARYLIEA